MVKKTLCSVVALSLCLWLVLGTTVACSGNASDRSLGGLTVTVRELDTASRSVAPVSSGDDRPYVIEIWDMEESPSRIIAIPDVRKSAKFSIGGLPAGLYEIRIYEETAEGLRPRSSHMAKVGRGGDTKVSVGMF